MGGSRVVPLGGGGGSGDGVGSGSGSGEAKNGSQNYPSVILGQVVKLKNFSKRPP